MIQPIGGTGGVNLSIIENEIRQQIALEEDKKFLEGLKQCQEIKLTKRDKVNLWIKQQVRNIKRILTTKWIIVKKEDYDEYKGCCEYADDKD
jgi:hypothetical protein